MGEYEKKQRNQLSRVITNSRVSSKRLKSIIDDRLILSKYKLINPFLNTNNVSQLVHGSFLPGNYANANAVALPAGAWAVAAAAHPFGVLPSHILRASLTMPVVPAVIGHGPGAGVPDSNTDAINYIPNQAHHIVEVGGGGDSGDAARALLIAAGIDINSSCNGVLLPSVHHDDAGNATVHLGSHKQEYADCVNTSLSRAINAAIPAVRAPAPGAIWPAGSTNVYARSHPGLVGGPRALWLQGVIVARLDDIRTMLLTENVLINEVVDGDWNPFTSAPMTITQVFANFGL